MNPRRWQEVQELFDLAAAHEPSQRAAFLELACDGDSELRREVESLLAADVTSDARLDQPLFSLHELVEPEHEGRRIGPYEIVRELGRGGLGAVYLAERTGQFRQQVALKLIKRGMDTDEVIGRFHVERQILANLEHVNIARLLDGGTTDDGLPYFVMERVVGEPLDQYCDARNLPIRARLELFLEVCSAVHYAHQNLVVHRDLKPGNILVSADGPKLLDFGIAKLLAPEGVSAGTLTRKGDIQMTPRYASPEQALGVPVTTATDVYSLGVILYELLTGQSPYRPNNGGLAEHFRMICEYRPMKPSTALRRPQQTSAASGDSSATLQSISEAREDSPRKLRRRLAGDLDSIVLKALHKQPEDRYSSVERLADDIRHYLSGLPARAREGTVLYRTAKFVKRNRWRLAAALAITLVIVGAVARHLHTARRIELAEVDRRLAAERTEEANLQAIIRTQFLDNLFTAADLEHGQSFTVRQLLERSERAIRAGLVGESLATQLENLALLYGKLTLREQAGSLLNEVLELRRELYGDDDHRLLARALNNLASWYYRGSEYQAAETLYRRSLEMRAGLGHTGVDLCTPMSNLALILMQRGEYNAAEDLYRRVLAIRRQAYGPDDRDVARSLRSLGTLLYLRGEFESAEPLLREAVSIRLRHFGERSAEVATTRSSLARVLHARGELTEAAALLRQVLEVREQLKGEDHLHVALTRKDLAAVLLSRGNIDAAEDLLRRALAILEQRRPDSWEIAEVRSLQGACLAKQGRYQEAEPLLSDGALRIEQLRGPYAVHSRNAYRRLDELYEAWGRDRPAWLDRPRPGDADSLSQP